MVALNNGGPSEGDFKGSDFLKQFILLIASGGGKPLKESAVYLGAVTVHEMSVPPDMSNEIVIEELIAHLKKVAPPFFLTPEMLQFKIIGRDPCDCGSCGRDIVSLIRDLD